MSENTRPGGAPLLPPAIAYGVLTIASGVLGASLPRMTATPAEVAAYATQNGTLMTVQATVMVASAAPLAVLAAVLRERLRRLGAAVPGPTIAFAGGLLAAAAIAFSGLVTWAIAATAATGDVAAAPALRSLAFAAGAAGFVVPMGLLLAGAAVPALILGLLPRWLAWAGLVVAVLAELAILTLLVPALDPLLPIGRFGGVLWLVAAAALLPARRARLRPDVRADAAS